MTDPLPPAPRPPSQWAIKALLAIALIFLLKSAQALLVPIVAAVVLAFVLAGPVRTLRRLGIPEYIGAALLLAGLLAVGALLGSSLATPAAQWLERAPTTVQQVMLQLDRLRAQIPLLNMTRHAAPPGPPVVVRSASTRRAALQAAAAASAAAAQEAASAAQASRAPDSLSERLADEGIALTRTVLSVSFTVLLSVAAMVILLYFLLASGHWMLSHTLEAVPRRRTRAVVLVSVRRAQNEIGLFLATLGVINVGVGIATTLALWGLGLENPTLWGTLAAGLNFIPYIGPIVMAGLLLLAGLLSFDTATMVLAPPAAFLLIHAVEANMVSPWFIGRRLSLNPLAVFLTVMIMAWLWGLAGAVLAVPLLVGVRCSLYRVKSLRLLRVFLEGGAANAQPLQTLLRPRRRSRLKAARVAD
jgi:predicted PurR-regulated permease PerM